MPLTPAEQDALFATLTVLAQEIDALRAALPSLVRQEIINMLELEIMAKDAHPAN